MFSKKNATRPVAYQKLIGLFLLLSCLFYSCKKEIITGEDLKVGVATNAKAKIQSIPYEKFASSVNQKQLGTLKRLVAPSPSNLNIQVAGSGTLSEVTISTDQVKRLEVSDTVSYVLSMELESPNSPTFRNLTIQQAKGKTTAFISTYTPTKEWILKRRATGHNPKFEGTVTYQMVPLSEQGSQVQAQMTCGYFVKFELVDMPCVGTGAQQHYNPEDCQYGSGEGGPWQDLVATVQWGCESSGGGGPSGNPGDGGTGTGNTGGGNTTPNYPEGYDPCASGEIKCSVPGSGTTPAQQLATQLDITDVKQIAFLDGNASLVTQLQNYLSINGVTLDRENFARWVVAYLTVNSSSVNINQFLADFFPTGPELIADPDADNWTDPDNEVLVDSDQTVYQQYQDNQPWPTVNRVIDFEKFVPIRKRADNPNKYESCLVLAKEQLGKVGYTCSGYLPGGQTFSIFTSQNGVNLTETKKAISYIISSLNQKIPVLIGVDNRPGAPLVNADKSTDHFVVIVGMGIDEKGKYFQFMDNATNNRSTGASYSNRLYYNSITGKITGITAIVDYRNTAGMHDYIVTQVRKSIKK